MKTKDKITAFLKSVLLFRPCSEAFLGALSASAVFKKLEKGNLLFMQDDPAERFFIVTHGTLKTFRETKDGMQVVMGILSEGKVFGETALFHDKKYPLSAETIEATDILSFPLSVLEHEIDTNPAFSKHMMSVMAQRERMQEQEIEHLNLQNAPQRIGCFILKYLSDGSVCGGHDDKFLDSKVTITLPYDKTLIAARLGMQPETFSRALKKLKADTDIVVNGSLVTIGDVRTLRSYSCSACSTPPN